MGGRHDRPGCSAAERAAGRSGGDEGKPRTERRCLTAVEANRGPAEIIKANSQCRFTRYAKKAGKLDSQMVCKQPDGTMTAAASGSFTATSFRTTTRMTMVGTQKASMTTLDERKRIGTCAN